MSERPKKPATYEDIVALPEHLIGEILNGELIVSPRPAIPHGWTASSLMGILWASFGFAKSSPGGWWILVEPELHLGDDVLVPDLAGWRRERMSAPRAEAFISMAPDWACEVLSSSTRRVDRELKLPIYAREGVGHVWFIDPQARALEVFCREEGGWRPLATFEGDERVRAEPFDAIELELGALWLPESPNAASTLLHEGHDVHGR